MTLQNGSSLGWIFPQIIIEMTQVAILGSLHIVEESNLGHRPMPPWRRNAWPRHAHVIARAVSMYVCVIVCAYLYQYKEKRGSYKCIVYTYNLHVYAYIYICICMYVYIHIIRSIFLFIYSMYTLYVKHACVEQDTKQT